VLNKQRLNKKKEINVFVSLPPALKRSVRAGGDKHPHKPIYSALWSEAQECDEVCGKCD